jgi:inner membrane protein involved in colicin E2 resistance
MVAAYCSVILQRRSRALVVATGVALLYAYLYTLLMNEDYALLAGSLGLFAILAAIMFATRASTGTRSAPRARNRPSGRAGTRGGTRSTPRRATRPPLFHRG